MDLVKTTNAIRDINVIYQEVKEVLDTPKNDTISQEDDDEFVIIDSTDRIRNIDVVDAEEVTSKDPDTECDPVKNLKLLSNSLIVKADPFPSDPVLNVKAIF